MSSEIEKMKAGQWYDANFDQEIVQMRRRAQDLCFQLNQLSPLETEKRQFVIEELLGYSLSDTEILSPFMCDYGNNITIGDHSFINMNCYFMDGAPITLGSHVFVGPSTGFYTAHHPLNYHYRNQGLEKALPITIGDNVWIGANVNIMPGVTIGSGCVIGSGSIVTKDIPADHLAVGSPCKAIRKIDQNFSGPY